MTPSQDEHDLQAGHMPASEGSLQDVMYYEVYRMAADNLHRCTLLLPT